MKKSTTYNFNGSLSNNNILEDNKMLCQFLKWMLYDKNKDEQVSEIEVERDTAAEKSVSLIAQNYSV